MNNKILCKFKFQCPNKWDALDATPVDGVKYCNTCEKSVYWADNQQELYALAKQNKCIAVNTYKITGYRSPRIKTTLGQVL